MTPLLKDLNDKERERIVKTVELTRDLLDTIISEHNGLLLLLEKYILERFRFSTKATFYDHEGVFCGALDFNRLQDNPVSLEFLPSIDKNIIHYVLAIYPIFYRYIDDSFEDVFAKSSLKVNDYDIYESDGEKEYVEALCEISVNDLIILHQDLIELENNIINNSPISIKETTGIKSRKGVSPKKILAKEQAVMIAKALWNNDKDEKIRIAEMARIVYAELYDSGLSKQLPCNQDSLQEWIRDIAPPYAKVGGRPKKNS